MLLGATILYLVANSHNSQSQLYLQKEILLQVLNMGGYDVLLSATYFEQLIYESRSVFFYGSTQINQCFEHTLINVSQLKCSK